MKTKLGTKRDYVFMEMAYAIAQLSKDESTHIGAIVVGPDHEIRSVGYNSLPRGVRDDVPERQLRPLKYFWNAHAEANAIFNAARIGVPLRGCRIYTNGTPCDKCAQAIINSGIIEVIIDPDWDKHFIELGSAEWLQSIEITKEMFAEIKPRPIKLWALKDFKTPLPRLVRGQNLCY